MPASFIHLRAHSAYSLLEGAIKTADLVDMAKEAGMPALALTDTNNMFGALEFAMAAVEEGIQPIVGCLIALHDGQQRKTNEAPRTFLPLLAKNLAGYKNLMALSSIAWLGSEAAGEAYVTLEQLEGHTEGLIAFTGGPTGPIGQLLLDSQNDAAEALLVSLKKLFPKHLYIELQRHSEGEIGQKEDITESHFLDMAYKHKLPLIATNEILFADVEMHEAHDALLCISAKSYMNDTARPRVTTQHRFKSPEEMRALFSDVPEAADNTVVVAKRCSFWPTKAKPILPPFKSESGRSEEDEVRAQAEEGLENRFAKNPQITNRDEYKKRLEFELDVIVGMGFAGYFLIVADFIKWAKARNIPVGPGRGSGVGSLVAWALTITDLDPIPLNLLFERFLNPERISMPDFDIDFCQERRDEVIAYVQGRYGADHVAQIITFGKLQARAVLRNVGRVLGMPLGYVDKICKLVPFNPANPVSLGDAIENEQPLQTMRDADPAVARLMDISLKLEGLYAHASTHAAGMVIGDRPLQQLVPLYRDPRSPLPVTQFNMKTVELAGLVKFDFLGLKTLSVLQLACNMVERKTGEKIDLGNLPLDDKPTYEMLSRGETLGVFQLEGAGMRDTLRRMKPTRFEDIIALVALYRPGPMDNIPKYIKVKNKEEEPDYLHPMLEPILKETYGIAIYQEQVMQIAQVLAGYTLGAADLLRRAMGKKIKEEMAAQRKNFVEGAVKKGVEAEQADMIFDQVDKFAGYGFNKSHAAAYALIAYHTAWMKAHHPVAFYAASMTFDMSSTDKLNVFRQELLRVGIPLLPPDINRSIDIFAGEDVEGREGIRYALAAIKGVGQEAMKALVREREANGPFTDLFNLASRLDSKVTNKRQMENLTCAGAFDQMEKNRARVFDNVEMLVKQSSQSAQERNSGQVSLFGGPVAQTVKAQLKDVKPWEDLLRLQKEFGALGFYLSSHPLDAFKPLLERLGAVRAAQLPSVAGASGSIRRKVAGILVSKQERTAKSGNRFAFIQLSDTTGMFEGLVFSEILNASRELLVVGTPLLLTLDVQGTSQEYRLTVQNVEKLEDVAARESLGLMLVLANEQALPSLADGLSKLPRGKSKIHLLIDVDGEEEAEVALAGQFGFSPEFRKSLKGLPGVLEVQDL